MNNEQCYLDRMRVGMYDKCWFLANIDTDVTTIIDFGCADGSLFRFIEAMYLDRFSYVGIENEKRFLDKCPQIPGRTSYLENIYEVKDIDWDRAILIMNSVCHEIYSYVGPFEVTNILDYALDSHIRHVAIRDMLLSSSIPVDSIAWNRIKKAFQNKYPEQYNDVLASGTDWREIAMKYTYTENWDREVKERYFHSSFFLDVYGVQGEHRDYNVTTQYFCIPQQIKRIERDLEVKWPRNTTTHVKFWISR